MTAEIPDFPLVYTQALVPKLVDLFGKQDAITIRGNFKLPKVGVNLDTAGIRDQGHVNIFLYRRDLAHNLGIKRRPWRASRKDRTHLQAPDPPNNFRPDSFHSDKLVSLPDWIA